MLGVAADTKCLSKISGLYRKGHLVSGTFNARKGFEAVETSLGDSLASPTKSFVTA